MIKTLIFFSLVFVSLQFVCLANPVETTKPKSDGYINHEIVGEPRPHRDDIVTLYRFPGWYKPSGGYRSFKGNTRLVLKIFGDGKAEINPCNEGPYSTQTIDLLSLTLEDAEKLWGKPRAMLDDVKTFDLISTTSEPERDIYHLDLKFKDLKLNAYRIRGIRITTPEWHNIK